MNSAIRTFFIFSIVLANSSSLFGMEELKNLSAKIVIATTQKTVINIQKSSSGLPQGTWEDKDRDDIYKNIEEWGDPFAKKADPFLRSTTKPEILPKLNLPSTETTEVVSSDSPVSSQQSKENISGVIVTHQ